MTEKLGRYLKGVVPQQAPAYDSNGQGIIKRNIRSEHNGHCCICLKTYSVGDSLTFDSSKEEGRRNVHFKCWQRKKKRGASDW